jgi:hypothetical protein
MLVVLDEVAPPEPVTVRVAVYVPAPEYTCATVVEVLSGVPSPKFQDRVVMLPVEVSVKFTVTGAVPEVGVAVKFATGAVEPTTLLTSPEYPLVVVALYARTAK